MQTLSIQPYYVSTVVPGKTKNSTETADRLLQCVLLNRLFQTLVESRTMFASYHVC